MAKLYKETQQDRLGNSGLWVSDVGLGTWKFGYPEKGDGSRTDEKTSLAIMDKAAELGVTFWDTADRYNSASGNSERVIGTWFKRNPSERTNIVVATKVRGQMNGDTPNHQGLGRHHILEGVKRCLERLRLDKIDLLQFHGPDPETPVEESIRAVDDLIGMDLIEYYGVSNFNTAQLAEFLNVADRRLKTRLISVQNRFNAITGENRFHQGVVDFSAAHGIGFIPFSPLAQGMLTDKYLDGDPGKGNRLVDEGKLDRVRTERNLGIVRTLQKVGEAHGKTIAQTALAWLLTHESVCTVIPSASSPEQVAQNQGASGFRLGEDEMKQVAEAAG